MTAPGEMLFVYGTLMESQVQEYVFGHPLEGVPDTLPGYIKKDKSVLDAYPGLQQASAALPPVTGMRLSLSKALLKRADVYEGALYYRTPLRLGSGVMAWVYLPNEDGKNG